ncbi:MAG: GNAT family N-acetyltransferase [Planctomycetota bacterium]
MALTVQQVASFDAPGLRAAWIRLSDTAPRASLFSTFEWCRAWADVFGAGSEIAVSLIHDGQGAPRGLLPAYVDRTGPVRWLKLLGRERVSGDHLDLLCAAEDHPACLDALWSHWERSVAFDGFILGDLHRDSPTLHGVRFRARQRGWPVQEREPQVVPYVDLPVTFDAYLDTLSANMRYHVRRRRRGLAKMLDTAVRVVSTPAEIDAALTDLFELHQRRWQRDGRPGNLHDARKREFLRQFCRVAAERDWVRAIVMEREGVRQGVLLAFHWRGTASFYQMGWDPDTPIQSPGVVLLAESIEQAVREGLSRYDFLRGDEPYKRKWTTPAVEQVTLVVGCRARARAAIAAGRLKERVKQTLGPAPWRKLKGLLRV